ncbi:MAG: hypothetical protein E4H07_00620 [Nitrosomonadales bacterium]|jgi:protein CpxP|nr:MAG: hypothetical protein E4H07_00620 [Nitrosomonadales bacterium]
MFYRKIMISTFIGTVFTFTFATVSMASALNNSIDGQSMERFMVAETHQHEAHENSSNQHHEKKGCCQYKHSMNKDSGGMMGHMRGGMRHGGYSYAHMIATHADELELSDAQLGRIVRLHMKHTQEHKQFKKNIHKSMMNFHHESMKPNTDDAILRKLGNDHVEAFKAMVEQHIRSRNVVHAILSAEQRERLEAMKIGHGEHGGGHGKSSRHGKHGDDDNHSYQKYY